LLTELHDDDEDDWCRDEDIEFLDEEKLSNALLAKGAKASVSELRDSVVKETNLVIFANQFTHGSGMLAFGNVCVQKEISTLSVRVCFLSFSASELFFFCKFVYSTFKKW
jgi:hypothetical protein